MKKIILIGTLGVVMCSCQNLFKNESARSAEDSVANQQIQVAARDYSITAANAYSDLFLDSTAVENYIRDQKLNDSTARNIRSFYNKRNYQFAWFTTQGLTEQSRGFWNLYDYSYNKAKSNIPKDSTHNNHALEQKMDTLLNEDTLQVNKDDSSFVNTELALTRQFIEFAQSNKDSTVNYSMIKTFFPVKKFDLMQYTDSLLNKQTSDSVFAGSNKSYQSMIAHLRKYYNAAQQGGWQPIAVTGISIKKGTSSPTIVAVKKRLHLTGDYQDSDTTAVYNDSLEVAIRDYQKRLGFKEDGIITDSLIKVMNVPVEQRIQQIVINMNRMLWTPAVEDSKQIHVNIPEFMMYVYEDTGKAMDMQVIAGKEGTNTMMFNGDLNRVVFSPYWNIPPDIVKEEILPKMKNDPNYLKSQNMEIVKQNDSLPEIRQLPGPKNSLGGVKFLFPNTYDIYLHDTPDKGLFQQDKRAFSHGCIRVARAEQLASYLLRNQPEWTPQRIKEAMRSGKEQTVDLKYPVPVAITYYTAWVDQNGQLHFRDDVYNHDYRTAQLMFSTPPNQKAIAINKAP